MAKKFYFTLILLSVLTLSSSAQFGKLKGLASGKKDTASQEESDTTKTIGKERVGGSFLNKAIIKLAKASSGLVMSATGQLITTDDLTALTPLLSSSSNLYPISLGTADMLFFKGWKTGGNLITVFFTQKDKFGMAKIDGSVTIDGEPADYVSTGVYVSFSEATNKPSKVEVSTKSGQKASFTISAPKYPVKIVSINGQTGDNISIDLSKDAVIELDNPSGAESLQLHAKLAINQLGIKSFYDVGYFKGSNKLIIPAAAFRNLNITPGGKMLYSFKNSYLSIDRVQNEVTTNTSGAFQPIDYYTVAQDGRFLNITKDPELNSGLTAKGSEKFPNGEVDYNFFKPNAFLSRPFDHIKKLGVMSFSIRGTTYVAGKESKSSSSYSVGNTTYTTTTTTQTWAQFPSVPTQVWNGALESLYQDFTNAAQLELGATVLPVNKVTGTEGYQSISPFSKDDETTSVSFFHSYKDTKMISAYIPVSEGYSGNSANSRIMKESGANALMKFTFDMQIAIEKGKQVMIPKLAFEIVGENNGVFFGTKYCTATITGKAVGFPKDNITVSDIERIIRKSDLLTVFRKGLQEIKAQEKQNGDYKLIWDLQ